MTINLDKLDELEALLNAVAGMKWEWLQAPLDTPAGKDAIHAVIVAYDKYEEGTHK